MLGHLGIQPDPLTRSSASSFEGASENAAELLDSWHDDQPVVESWTAHGHRRCDGRMGRDRARAQATPMFPVDTFGEILSVLTPVLVDREGWRDLVDHVDAAVSVRAETPRPLPAVGIGMRLIPRWPCTSRASRVAHCESRLVGWRHDSGRAPRRHIDCSLLRAATASARRQAVCARRRESS